HWFVSRCAAGRRQLLSVPTRRSSDLVSLAGRGGKVLDRLVPASPVIGAHPRVFAHLLQPPDPVRFLEQVVEQRERPEGRRFIVADRKSTRLNSSHVKMSYAVFCLKKK